MSYVPFVDISHYQGNVDFGRMARQGVKAVLAKVSEGGAPDPKWPQYAHDARAAGLWIGGYCFVQCASSLGAEGQGRYFADKLQAVGGDLMLHMYDFEWSGAGTMSTVDRAAYYTRCVNAGDSQIGRKGSIYTIKSFWRDYTGNSPVLADHDLIVATARGGTPPTDAALWGAWFEQTGGVLPPKYYPVGPWTDWAACQFSVANVGPTYGVQSVAIDMDVVKADVFARWTGQIVEDDLPLNADDLAAITKIVQTEVAKAITATNAVPAGVWAAPIAAQGGLGGGPAYAVLQEARSGVRTGAASQTSLNSVAASVEAHLDAQDAAQTADTQKILDELDGVTPGTGQDMTKVHLDSIPGHFQVDL